MVHLETKTKNKRLDCSRDSIHHPLISVGSVRGLVLGRVGIGAILRSANVVRQLATD